MTSPEIKANPAVAAAASGADLALPQSDSPILEQLVLPMNPEAQIKMLEQLVLQMNPNALQALSLKAQGKLLEAFREEIGADPPVVGKITFDGKQLETRVSEGSFESLLKWESDQYRYLAKLGYRMADHDETVAYIKDLLEKKEKGTLNQGEAGVLDTIEHFHILDDEGYVWIGSDGRIEQSYKDELEDNPLYIELELFVRDSSESK